MILPLASTPYLTPSYYISKHRIGLNILNDNKNHEYQKLDQVDFFTGRLNVYVFSGDEKHFFFFFFFVFFFFFFFEMKSTGQGC